MFVRVSLPSILLEVVMLEHEHIHNEGRHQDDTSIADRAEYESKQRPQPSLIEAVNAQI
jgi:hypothetical protein